MGLRLIQELLLPDHSHHREFSPYVALYAVTVLTDIIPQLFKRNHTRATIA
jgi:hypothetical protein